MIANAQPKTAPVAASLTGAEKVAVVLLALGKQRAAKLLKRFDPEELKRLSRSAGDLRPISTIDLESLVEEFAQKFSSGVNFVGTEAEVQDLLSQVMADGPPEEPEEPVREGQLWEKVSKTNGEVLRSYLTKEHPQTAALILSRIDSASAAKIISAFPADVRNELLLRMLGIKKVSEDAVRALEAVLEEDLLAAPSSGSHAGIADILNRLDKAQSEEVLKSLAEARPEDAKTLKSMLFTFEELIALPPRARTLLFDQVPIERLVIALKGTDSAFQTTVLSSLAARSRRMVEAELQGGSAASARDVADARRAIVDVVLKMMARGEIEPAAADGLDGITV